MELRVVDARDLALVGAAGRRQQLEELAQAGRECGAFLVRVDDDFARAATDALAIARAYFDLPDATKRAHAAKEGRCGYYEIGDAYAQLRERFFVAGSAHPFAEAAGYARYPAEIVGFRAVIGAFHARVEALGRTLLAAIAESLAMPPGALGDAFETPGGGGLWAMRYPALAGEPTAARRFGASAHTDLHPLALIVEDLPGLEVRVGDAWHRVPPDARYVACCMGDLLARWTNDVFVANPHRVLNDPERARHSLCTFMHARPDFVIAPLATCVTAERPARTEPTTWSRCFEAWLEGMAAGTAGARRELD